MKNIHRYEKQLDNCKKNIQNSKKISGHNKKLILEFGRYCLVSGLGKARRIRLYQLLKQVGSWADGRLDRMDKDNLYSLLEKIESKDYTEWTRYTYQVCLRQFCRWLEEHKGARLLSGIIKPSTSRSGMKLPEELLTKEDIIRMVQACQSPRDRAFIMTLYESGARISEIGTMKRKSISFDQYGPVIIVKGKTGMRRIRLITSAPYLSEWLRCHKGDQDSPLWTNRESVSYAGLSSVIRRAAKRAGIRKRVYPHLFRHSRATELAKKFTEAQMKNYFGWTQSSRMAAVYVHLSGRDIDDAILEMHGIKKSEKEKAKTHKTCPRCEYKNPIDLDFCHQCHSPLDAEAAMRAEKDERYLVNKILSQLSEQLNLEDRIVQMVREMPNA